MVKKLTKMSTFLLKHKEEPKPLTPKQATPKSVKEEELENSFKTDTERSEVLK